MNSLKVILAVACVYVGGFSAAEVRNGHRGWIGPATLGVIAVLVVVLWLENRLGK